MDSQGQDIIGLKEAARISGKAERTVRRWVKKGTLKDMRAPGDATSPIVVSLQELRAHLATLSTPPEKGQPQGSQGQPSTQEGEAPPAQGEAPQARPAMVTQEVAIEDHPLVEALREQIAILRVMVSMVEGERDRLLVERGQFKAEVEDLRVAKASLERELAGREGIRGLLKAFWPL